MPEVTNLTGLRIEHIQTLVQSTRPDAASSIDEQRAYRVAGERVRIVRVVPERLEVLRPPIPAGHAAAVRGQPQVALRVLRHRPDIVAGKSVLITALTAVLADRVAVVTVEAVFGPQPQVTLRVLQDAVDGALRKPIAHREMLEIHGLHGGHRGLRARCRGRHYHAGCQNTENAPAASHSRTTLIPESGHRYPYSRWPTNRCRSRRVRRGAGPRPSPEGRPREHLQSRY